MAGMHVAHDCVIGDTVLATNVLLAGHVVIEDHVLIGVDQPFHNSAAGAHAFIGGMTAIVGKDVPPFVKVTAQTAALRP